MDTPKTGITFPKQQKYVVPVLLIIGIILRLLYFFQNRSLWIDETYLSNSVVTYSIGDLLTRPLMYYQKAPLGFLTMQKMFVTLFSPSEMSLRIFPLICGILSLCIFPVVARHFLKQQMIWLAMSVFCLAPALIFHAAEAKHYSSELLSSLIAVYLYVKMQSDGISKKSILRLGAAGAVLIWFSYAVIFILVAISLSISLKVFKKKDARLYIYYFSSFFLWLISFVINFYFSTHRHAESAWTIYWFDFYRSFAPLLPKTLNDLAWYPVRFYRMLDYPLGLLWNFLSDGSHKLAPVLKMSFIPVGLMLTGCIYMYKRKTDFALMVFSITLTLVASGLKLYPLQDRFWVFLSPLFIILIVYGCQFMNEKWIPARYSFLIPLLLLTGSVTNIVQAFGCEEFIVNKTSSQRQAFQYINNRFQKDDLIYIYWSGVPGYKVYQKMYPFQFVGIEGRDYRKEVHNFDNYITCLKKDIKKHNKKRVWILLNYTFQSDIGEPVNWPKWYFEKGDKPSDRVIAALKQDWDIVDVYRHLDTHVYYFTIK